MEAAEEQLLSINDIEQTFKEIYSAYKVSMQEASKDDEGNIMTECQEQVYKFDTLANSIFRKESFCPSGVDAVHFGNLLEQEAVNFIEFKNGTIEESLPADGRISEACEANGEKSLYLEIKFGNFRHLVNLEKKALESRLILENEILGGCNLKQNQIRLHYILVYNEEKNGKAAIQQAVSKKANKSIVRFGLHKLKKMRYYNDVATLTKQEFEEILKRAN